MVCDFLLFPGSWQGNTIGNSGPTHHHHLRLHYYYYYHPYPNVMSDYVTSFKLDLPDARELVARKMTVASYFDELEKKLPAMNKGANLTAQKKINMLKGLWTKVPYLDGLT